MKSPDAPVDPFDRIADALEALVRLKRYELQLPLPNDADEPVDIFGRGPADDDDALGVNLIDDALSADYELERTKQATPPYPSR